MRVPWTARKSNQSILNQSRSWVFLRRTDVEAETPILWPPDAKTRRSNQSILKEISPGYLLEGLMLKLKLQYFGHLMQRADSLEKILMLGKRLGAGGERDNRG